MGLASREWGRAMDGSRGMEPQGLGGLGLVVHVKVTGEYMYMLLL